MGKSYQPNGKAERRLGLRTKPRTNALKGQKQYAIGLKPSRTRDYLKQLLEMGLIEEEGEVRYKVYSSSQVA